MKKVLLIMAAALMTMTQCRKQETVPATPSANTIKMTITAGPGAKTDITDEGRITWTSGDKLYVSDGAKWLGILDLKSGAGDASGTFTGEISEISDGTTCHFFYLGHDNDMTGATGTTNAVISFASQDGSKDDALKYHLGHGSADVKVSGGAATGAVAMMRTEIAIAHLKLKMNGEDYTGSVTMDVSNTMTVSPAGDFSGSGNGIAIGNNGGTPGDRYVTLIPTGTSSVDVSFSGSATGSMTFGHGIQANNLYGMKNGIEVTLNKVPVTDVSLDKTKLSLEEGETETLTATVTPDNATYKDVTWSSSATGVATVDNGVVTAVKAGNATITVTTVDGSKIATCYVTVTAPSYLPGEFSVGTGKVKFAPGNLYWDGSSWKFEANQYDYRTYARKNSCINGSVTTNGTPNGHWGLFGWSGSDQTHYGKNTSKNNSDYSGGSLKDWGGNVIGDDAADTWRTLTDNEWKYLLNTNGSSGRTDANRFAKAKVNGVCGLLIFPDGYNGGEAIGSITGVAALNTTNAAYPTESIPDATWTSMESAGVVFLPAAGYRLGTAVYRVGLYGLYWSSTPYGSDYAYSMCFLSGDVSTSNYDLYNGGSVRLVRSAS